MARWLPAAAAAAAALVAFVAVERRARDPFVALSLFESRPYMGAAATVLLHNLVMYALLLIVPVLAERELGSGPSGAGLLIGAMTASMMVVSPVGGHLSDRRGRRAPVLVGTVLAVAATARPGGDRRRPRHGGRSPPSSRSRAWGSAWPARRSRPPRSRRRRATWWAWRRGVFSTARYTGGIAAAGVAAAVSSSGGFRTGFAVLLGAAALSLVSAAALTGRSSGRVPVADHPSVRPAPTRSPGPPAAGPRG